MRSAAESAYGLQFTKRRPILERHAVKSRASVPARGCRPGENGARGLYLGLLFMGRPCGAARGGGSISGFTGRWKGQLVRNYLAIGGLVCLFSTSVVRAGGGFVTFDFNALDARDRASAISDYMTTVYGSTVSVDGARAFAEETDDSDLFIATSFQLFNRGDFEIVFEEVSILGAQFQGHVIDGTLGDDFSFTAFDGDTERFSFSRDDGVTVFDSGWLDFGGPVDRLVITDGGRKDVGIDDLTVAVVPDPATGLLLLAGACVGRAFRRRRE